MKRTSQLFVIVGLMLVSAQAQAQAQMLKWEDRAFINGNIAFQSRSAQDVASVTSISLYDETAQVTSAQTIEAKGAMVDVAGGVRLFGNFGVGVAFNTISKKTTGAISAQVPHPLFYDQPRTATSQVDALNHKETAIHVMGLFVLPLSAKFDVTLSAGPTFFMLQQDTVATVQIGADVAPYTTATLTNVSKVTTKKSKVGFNAGLDATIRLSRHFGLGGFVRYAATSMEFTPDGGSALTMDVGGIQFGGGLRIRF